MSAATTTIYVGWHRTGKGSPWRPIVEANSEETAFRQLLDAVAGGDKVILPKGQTPSAKPSALQRRRF